MAGSRTVPEAVSDWLQAYNAVKAEVTPVPIRVMLTTLLGDKPPETVEESLALLKSSLVLAQLVCANDRAAAHVAAMLTGTGITRHERFDVLDGDGS